MYIQILKRIKANKPITIEDTLLCKRAIMEAIKAQIKMFDQCLGSYHVECTGSRPITEVKQRRARLVLGWVTAWEYRVF
jgi:hypothetical protein